jgi:hypothetical protein
VRRYRDVSRAEGGAIVWERLEQYELKRRERGMAAASMGRARSRPCPPGPSGTTFCDSAGVRAIIAAYHQAAATRTQLRLVATVVLRILQLLGVD